MDMELSFSVNPAPVHGVPFKPSISFSDSVLFLVSAHRLPIEQAGRSQS